MGAIEISSRVRLVLLTGSPGGGKTVVSKLLGCHLSEPWEVVHLDHYLYLRSVQTGDFWDDVEASAAVRAASIKYYSDRRGRVIYEGIIQSNREVDVYCDAAKVERGSDGFRFFDLRCSKEEAVRRMRRRLLKEDDQFDFGGQYDGLVSRLNASGATPIDSDGKTPQQVMLELVAEINGETRPPPLDVK